MLLKIAQGLEPLDLLRGELRGSSGLAQRLAEVEAARALVFNTAWRDARGEKVAAEVSMIKALCGELVNRVVVLDMGEPSWLLAFFQPREIFLAPNEQIQKNTVTISLLSMGGAVALASGRALCRLSPVFRSRPSSPVTSATPCSTSARWCRWRRSGCARR